MRRQLPNLLLPVELDLLAGVDGEDLVGIHRHQDGARVGVYQVVVVSDEQVSQDAGLVEVAEADHVLHPLDGGRVHGLDPPLRSEPQLLAVIVDHLKPMMMTMIMTMMMVMAMTIKMKMKMKRQ